MCDFATTIIIISNSKAEAAIRELFNDKGQLDFNKIIPQPKNIFNGDLSQDDIDRCAASGIPTWKSWNPDNWGTKWNACETRIQKLDDGMSMLTFSTPWCRPRPIIDKMLKMIPGIQEKHLRSILV